MRQRSLRLSSGLNKEKLSKTGQILTKDRKEEIFSLKIFMIGEETHTGTPFKMSFRLNTSQILVLKGEICL